MNRHLDLLGYLYLALGVLGLVVAAIVFFALVGGGLLAGDTEVRFVTTTAGLLIGGFITLLSLPGFIEGYGLLNRRSWARPLGYVLAILNLFNVPLGTLLAVYTFWVLTSGEAQTQLSR